MSDFGDLGTVLNGIRQRKLNVKSVLDVGANKAGWSEIAKMYFPDANFYLIEPLSEMEPYLKGFCEKNPGSRYFLNGAGSKIEKHVLTTWGDDLAGASCLVEPNSVLQSMNKQREISIVTIDSLIEEHGMPIPEIVKMDVQGFEIEALKGSNRLIGATELFILESSLFKFSKPVPLLSELIAFMTDKGYEIYDFAGYLRRPNDGALGQIDICFALRNGFLRSSNDWGKPVSAETANP